MKKVGYVGLIRHDMTLLTNMTPHLTKMRPAAIDFCFINLPKRCKNMKYPFIIKLI